MFIFIVIYSITLNLVVWLTNEHAQAMNTILLGALVISIEILLHSELTRELFFSLLIDA